MKKLLVCFIVLTCIKIQGYTVLFKEPGKISYEELIEQATAKNSSALQTLHHAWQPNGDAHNFEFISKYLINQGFSALQTQTKLAALHERSTQTLATPNIDSIHEKTNENYENREKITQEANRIADVLDFWSPHHLRPYDEQKGREKYINLYEKNPFLAQNKKLKDSYYEAYYYEAIHLLKKWLSNPEDNLYLAKAKLDFNKVLKGGNDQHKEWAREYLREIALPKTAKKPNLETLLEVYERN